MKRKELYNYIREEIINELSETTYAGKGAVEKIKKDPKFNTLKSDAKVNALSDLNTGGDVELEEDTLSELASYKFFRVADREKFNALKDIYAGTLEARVLDAIAEAGEQGTTQAALATTLGTVGAVINPILKKFGSVNAITLPVSEKPGKAAAEEPEIEEPETEEPETPESDFFASDKDSEEEKDMEPIDEPSEPSAADIAAAEKEVGSIDTEKIEAANKAADIVRKLTAKIEGMKKGPEREKKMAALKQYVKNNRGAILKGFKISDLTNGLIS